MKFQTKPWIDKKTLHKINEKTNEIKKIYKHKIPSETLDMKIEEIT